MRMQSYNVERENPLIKILPSAPMQWLSDKYFISGSESFFRGRIFFHERSFSSISILMTLFLKLTLFLSLFLFLFISGELSEGLFSSHSVFGGENTDSFKRDFVSPPKGYGEVPFWWWTGEKLDSKRLLWEIEQLHEKGISGVQINYAHEDTAGWPTYKNDPEIFTPDWWAIFEKTARECRKRGMGIGLSCYTIDWQGSPTNLFARIIYNDRSINSRTIVVREKINICKGSKISQPWKSHFDNFDKTVLAVVAYPKIDGQLRTDRGLELLSFDSFLKLNSASFTNDISSKTTDKVLSKPIGNDLLNPASKPVQKNKVFEFTLNYPDLPFDGEIWIYGADRVENTLNPLHPESGHRVITKFFQPFEDHVLGSGKQGSAQESGLNYFFQDELRLGTGSLVWHDDLFIEFQKRKGYPLYEALPAMFGVDCGDKTEKYKLDFMDVRVRLAEERYFIPIFNWHNNRGMIYACDSAGRGKSPEEFCDYFSAVRWYTAPGHDTPGGHADFIKNKVSASIAHFYQRPRVWLEGYHSFGWGATPEQLLFATNENYLFGANLLNLHGLYYSTYGGFWEWAPPCYHFRMPYWDDFAVFLKYFERLSWLMTRGVQQADLVILYPVTPGQVDSKQGKKATEAAFRLAHFLFNGGRDLLFIDDNSVARSKIIDGKISVANAEHRILILPEMAALRFSTAKKALDFYRQGGTVIAFGQIPGASDRAGRNDPELVKIMTELFGQSRLETGQTLRNNNKKGGQALATSSEKEILELLKDFPFDVRNRRDDKPVKIHHRRTQDHDIYMIMGAHRNAPLTFQASGKVEILNCWDGSWREVAGQKNPDGSTTITAPFGQIEAGLVLFSPKEMPSSKIESLPVFKEIESIPLVGQWQFELIPTLDNRYGDFRLPITKTHALTKIGAEARRLFYRETKENKIPDFSEANRVLYGFGQKFWKLGPLPQSAASSTLEKKLARLTVIDPNDSIVENEKFRWTPYSFSWRLGIEGNPGHQGYHGLKENLDDRFIGLGVTKEALNETVYVPEKEGSVYYLWTTVTAEPKASGTLVFQLEGGAPDSVYLDGKKIDPKTTRLVKSDRPHPLLIRYNKAGRYAFCLTENFSLLKKSSKTKSDSNSELDQKASISFVRTPLSMKWYDDSTRIDFDPFTVKNRPFCWYQFTAPPGLKKIEGIAFGDPSIYIVNQKSKQSFDFVFVETKVKSIKTVARRNAFAFESVIPKGDSSMKTIIVGVRPIPGYYGGSVFPEPIDLTCDVGPITTGDWNKFGVLENYSGSARYTKSVTLDQKYFNQDSGSFLRSVQLDLGSVCASCRVYVNGIRAGVLVAAPWRLDITKWLKPGNNKIEVTVSNTLANFYSTLPSRYKGNSPSGLIGPVMLRLFE